MFPYDLLPITKGHKCERTEEEKKERANFYADRRMAYKVARGEVMGNFNMWKRRFPEVFLNVEVEKANKTIDRMAEQTKDIREKLRN